MGRSLDEPATGAIAAPVNVSRGMDQQRKAQVIFASQVEYLKTLIGVLLQELNSLDRDGGDHSPGRLSLKAEVERFEKTLISNALVTTFGRQRQAARLLGTNATTLNTKIKRLGITLNSTDDFALRSAQDLTAAREQPLNSLPESLITLEIDLIRDALKFTHGNQTKAARLLRIPATTLNSKIQKYGIHSSEFGYREMRAPGPSLNLQMTGSSTTQG
ncbi:MAG TPA: helix-turn-helix domain-containing protein [Pyrinomonadaceae bacterium]|nr:helix-turn-helix domain-containing protein [Pyrinomonadaceae bacterium]